MGLGLRRWKIIRKDRSRQPSIPLSTSLGPDWNMGYMRVIDTWRKRRTLIQSTDGRKAKGNGAFPENEIIFWRPAHLMGREYISKAIDRAIMAKRCNII